MTNPPGDDGTPHQPPSGPEHGQEHDYGQPYGQQYPQQYPDDYGQQYQYGYAPTLYPAEHPKATTVLVLGILGLVLCGVAAPFAWVMGRRTLQEIDASNGQLGGRGSAQAGYVMGIIGSIFLGLAVLAIVLLVVLFVVLAGGTMVSVSSNA